MAEYSTLEDIRRSLDAPSEMSSAILRRRREADALEYAINAELANLPGIDPATRPTFRFDL